MSSLCVKTPFTMHVVSEGALHKTINDERGPAQAALHVSKAAHVDICGKCYDEERIAQATRGRLFSSRAFVCLVGCARFTSVFKKGFAQTRRTGRLIRTCSCIDAQGLSLALLFGCRRARGRRTKNPSARLTQVRVGRELVRVHQTPAQRR